MPLLSGKEMLRETVNPLAGGLMELPANVKAGVEIPCVPDISIVGPPLDTPEATAVLNPAADHTNDVAAGD